MKNTKKKRNINHRKNRIKLKVQEAQIILVADQITEEDEKKNVVLDINKRENIKQIKSKVNKGKYY